ncbi:MAG: hypothetical protein GY884_19735, partial [Proteobacteria bacterium]|nr:hypothetical protein [Pseudomonadota bacterium]
MALFARTDSGPGNGLWRTDGTLAGTFQLTASASGTTELIEDFLYHAPTERVFFTYSEASGSAELWSTDGTAAGTALFTDLHPGWDPKGPRGMTRLDDRFVFAASDPTSGRELWISDGTVAGTQLLADLNPTGDSSPEYLTAAGDLIYFAADDGVHGREPWVTDGTAAGTHMLTDIHLGPGDSMADTPWWPELSESRFTAVGDKVLFGAATFADGIEPWVSDGRAAGTMQLDVL